MYDTIENKHSESLLWRLNCFLVDPDVSDVQLSTKIAGDRRAECHSKKGRHAESTTQTSARPGRERFMFENLKSKI